MLRATLPNKKSIKEYERDIKHELDKKYEEEPLELEKGDLLAMIIAGYQLIMPMVLIGALIFGIFTYVFLNFFMK